MLFVGTCAEEHVSVICVCSNYPTCETKSIRDGMDGSSGRRHDGGGLVMRIHWQRGRLRACEPIFFFCHLKWSMNKTFG